MDRRILVVDDSEPTCSQLSRLLARPDRRIKVAHDGTAALEWLVEGNFSLVLTDLHLPGIDGLELIREIRQRELPITAIVMTGHASIDSAVEAMKLGAYDYLSKPIDPLRLEVLVDQALKDRTLRDEVAALRRGLHQRFAFHNLLGQGSAMREVFARIARVAASGCTVLISGETGTGKELVAQALHDADPARGRGPLVTVNCAALPEPLLESELFGHEKGAFTGADRQKPGRFELAKGGSLFLDEVGEMPLSMQAKLLRVLQDGRFERVGGSEPILTDCRVLAATHIDLEAAVAAGRFREDLYYRLNVVRIDVPPLRDRTEDIPILVDHFLTRLHERRYPSKTFAKAALDRLARHEWPGNVRELEHLVEQLVVTTSGPVVEPEDLPPQIVSTREAPFSLEFDLARHLQDITDELTERIERAYLIRVLETHSGRIDRISEHCGLSRRSISEKLRRYRIDKADFKPHVALRRALVLED
ncbi:MAG: response regulator with CheY-like receiver, AAA-type ATPase, and DNA-binding domain [Planctomycetota bacterium]|nr:response regulator with CheY-like receiver, AAA-type ATPase, and DNA-binding domain [Planctomycetota bacterium]